MTRIQRRFIGIGSALLMAASLSAAPTDPQTTPQTQAGSKTQSSVEKRLEVLEEEIEKAKLKKATRQYKSYGGLGPAASGVYYAGEGLSWGGYGEIKYRNYKSSYKDDQVDVHRFILYAGYRFNDWIVMNSEIEYEHAGFEEKTVASTSGGSTSVNSGDVFVEFAYIDLEFSKAFQVSLGLNLVPVGIINYQHEPTTFFSVERPETESNIIPSTWREIGAIVHGEFLKGAIVYRTGVMNGGDATGFSSGSWIRGGRTKGSKAKANNPAYVFNVEYKGIEGLAIGGSYYQGLFGQNAVTRANLASRFSYTSDGSSTGDLIAVYADEAPRGNRARVRVHIGEGHFDYKTGPFAFRGLFARGWMSDEDTRAVNKSTGNNVGKVVEGAYLEAAFNVLSLFDTKHKLYLFARHEYVNTQKETARRYAGGEEDILDSLCSSAGCSTGDSAAGIVGHSDSTEEMYGITGVADRAQDRRITTVGLSYLPHPNVALKLDYEHRTSKTHTYKTQERFSTSNNKIDRVNVAATFIF